MFSFFKKKISVDDIFDAVEQKNIEPILEFVKRNKRKITDMKQIKQGIRPKEASILNKINFDIIHFPLEDFKVYIETLHKSDILPQFMLVNTTAPIDFFHNCIRNGKIQHAGYLLKRKLFSINPNDFQIWINFLHGTLEQEEYFLDTFHFIMQNGGDLNKEYGGQTVLEQIFMYSNKFSLSELDPYLHSLTEKNMKVYKENRLQRLF